jgi:hypothetical protein
MNLFKAATHHVLQARKVVQSRKQQAELDSVRDRLQALEVAFLGNKSETMSTAHPSVSVLGSLRQRILELDKERDFAAAAAQLVFGPAGAAALNCSPDGIALRVGFELTNKGHCLWLNRPGQPSYWLHKNMHCKGN